MREEYRLKQHALPVLSRRKFLALVLSATFTQRLTDKAALASGAVIPYRRLGRTNQLVSIIGVGGFHIGMPWDENEGIKIIRTAIDNGVNFLDNCWDYNDGVSEIRMGKALRNGYREKAFLMTKIDGRRKPAAARQIDESLRRLQTDVIDLMQLHEINTMDEPDVVWSEGGAMEALFAAKKAGKIRYIGFTGHKSPAIHLKMLNIARAHKFNYDAVQLPLNVMDAHFDSFEKKVLPVLKQNNIAVLGMKAMGGGRILRCGAVSAVECLRYSLSLDTSVVITGCNNMRLLEQALAVARSFKPLTAAERTELLARTAQFAEGGRYECYKSSNIFDGTFHHPEWKG